MKEFYDGQARPNLNQREYEFMKASVDRICLNCGQRYGKHFGNSCPNKKELEE